MPTLEEALIGQGLVQPHQLEEAKRLDRDLRGGLGLNLVRLRHVSEDDLVEAFRRAVPGIQVADQAAVGKASSFALGLVPLTMIERFRAVPLSLQGSQLTLAMANPLDTDAITSMERHTRCKVVPALAAESVISWALLRYFNVLTPSYSAAGPVGRGAATVSVTDVEEDAGMAIPLLRRRRAPVGDTPEELSQVPVDLAPSRRKSLPPGTGGADMGKLEAALARMKRQIKRTVQAAPVETVVAARPLPPTESKAADAAPAAAATTPEPQRSRKPPLRIPPVIKTLPPPSRAHPGTTPAAVAPAPTAVEEKPPIRAPTSLEERPPAAAPPAERAGAPAETEPQAAPAPETERGVIKTRAFGSVPEPEPLEEAAPAAAPEPEEAAAEPQPPSSETDKTVVTETPAPPEPPPATRERRAAATVPLIVSAPAPAKPLAFIPPPMILPGAKLPPGAASPAAPKPVILPPAFSTPRTHEPVPPMRNVAVAKPLEMVGTSDARGRPAMSSSTRPVPLMPEPGPVTPVPESARRPSAPPSSTSSVPPPPSGSQPPGGRVRQTTPRMGVGAPFSPTTPGLPGLLPVSEQAVQRLRERIANLEDRDAVTASALWTVEEVLGPAAFVTRQEAGYKVHRAGKHFRAIFGEGELVLGPGQEPRIEHAQAVNEAQAHATEGFPLRPIGHRSVPPRVVMLPVMIAGHPAGVFVAFTEKALEVLAGEMPRYKVVTSSVADRLLAILKKKKGK